MKWRMVTDIEIVIIIIIIILAQKLQKVFILKIWHPTGGYGENGKTSEEADRKVTKRDGSGKSILLA